MYKIFTRLNWINFIILLKSIDMDMIYSKEEALMEIIKSIQPNLYLITRV